MLIFILMGSKFKFHQVKDLLFIILPLFTVYLTIIMKFITVLDSVPAQLEYHVSGPIIFIGRLFPFIFAIYMILVIVFHPAGTSSSENNSFMQMKELIGWGEATFGFYIGYIVQAVFQKIPQSNNQSEELISTLKQIQKRIRPIKNISDTSNDLTELKSLIGQGDIQEAFDKLKNYIFQNDSSNKVLNQVINLSSQYYRYAEQKRLNLVNDDTIANKVTKGLLEIIDELDS